MVWESVIGLEVHVSLSTASKLFSGTASNFGADPNTQANVFDPSNAGHTSFKRGSAQNGGKVRFSHRSTNWETLCV